MAHFHAWNMLQLDIFYYAEQIALCICYIETEKAFSKTFTVNGEKLPLELIAGKDINETRVYGPDFSSTGAYHLAAPFLKGKADYTISVEIATINSKQPQNKITDQFSLRTIT